MNFLLVCEQQHLMVKISSTRPKTLSPSNAPGRLYFILIIFSLICLLQKKKGRKVTAWKHHASLLQIIKCFIGTIFGVIQGYTLGKISCWILHFWFHSMSNFCWWLKLRHIVIKFQNLVSVIIPGKNTSGLTNYPVFLTL